jgi:CheY-like chemotaxis protein
LILEGPGQSADSLLRATPEGDLVRVADLARGLGLLRSQRFDAVLADARDPAVRQWAGNLLQSERILEALPDGVAVVDPELRIFWANTTFEHWCGGGPCKHRVFYEALNSPEVLGPDYNPFHTALAGKIATTRLHCRDNRYLELHVTPIHEEGGKVRQLIALGRDITAQVQQQQKLDAIHQAGQELAALSPEQLSEMSVEERIELLKLNIRRFTHDLLHYDVIEVRLLDRQTGGLVPLLAEGMTDLAATRVLYPKAEGNGVTGYVAATGKSYVCPDTATDPLYIEGASGARSSLTVPIVAQDEVIGTFNVESPQPNAFGEDDLQFAEIFSREIANTLHTLELLTAEKQTTATQSVEAVGREVALPVDEILAAATAVLDRYIGHDPEMGDKLRQIIASARALKQSIQKVGEDLVPAKPAARASQESHPRLKGLRVLVVDNDERVRRSAHAILGRFGCVVETARDGREAMTMARLSAYDAVLVDIRLPDLNGHEMYTHLRQIQPLARIILMTAYGYDPSHSIVKARQEGLRAVLFKPFRIDQLISALESPDAAPGAEAKPEVVQAS